MAQQSRGRSGGSMGRLGLLDHPLWSSLAAWHSSPAAAPLSQPPCLGPCHAGPAQKFWDYFYFLFYCYGNLSLLAPLVFPPSPTPVYRTILPLHQLPESKLINKSTPLKCCFCCFFELAR
ncbi:hypothetical protein E2320_006868, partial [Naja naja]